MTRPSGPLPRSGTIFPRSVTIFFALALTLGGLPLAAGAQDAALTESERRLAALFGSIGADQPVRVGTPSTFVEATGVAAVAVDHVELTSAGTLVDVGFSDVRNVAVRDSHWLQGTLWGAGAGLLVGTVAGMLISSFDCETPAGCINEERNGMITWAATLGGAGALGGFMIGRRSFYWHPIFP